ncbi:MAG TPA: hypothetical protein VMV43_05235 [Candidatus Nanopelagicaceae bacterium]|nr:hypothetical protein [Candidatus Nanopelagicaceae bacterium]
MYQFEKINDSCFYIKVTGTLPPPVAERFIEEFKVLTKDINENLSIIVDISDAILLSINSIDIILELLKKNNERLFRSAFIIEKNPPLNEEIKYLLDHAQSPKRKIVSNIEEAKEWIGIDKIVFKR